MSHFVVLVELPAGTSPQRYEHELDERLAPFDEELGVEAYRSYLEDLDDEKRHYVERYELTNATGEPASADDVTWQQIVTVHNERNANDESSWLHLDAETGQPYRMSTRNPNAKWDWWSIGGRYHGYFTAKPNLSSANRDRLILGSPSWLTRGDTLEEYACDGGPLGLLDLEARRAAQASRAQDRYDLYQSLVEGLPAARSWSEMLDIYGVKNIDTAREQYRMQPRIETLRQRDEFVWGCPIDEFKWGEELYVQRASDGAVPGYAHLTVDGEWLARGEMGWFGMSSDTVETSDAYDALVNARLNDLDLEIILAVIDCHI